MAFAVFIQRGIQSQLFSAIQQCRNLLQRLAQRDIRVNAKEFVVICAARAEGDGAEGFDRGWMVIGRAPIGVKSCHFWFSGLKVAAVRGLRIGTIGTPAGTKASRAQPP